MQLYEYFFMKNDTVFGLFLNRNVLISRLISTIFDLLRFEKVVFLLFGHVNDRLLIIRHMRSVGAKGTNGITA